MPEATPRISVTKLAEFMEVPVNRQERIVRDQLKRTGFKARRHRSTRAALVRFLMGGCDPLALKNLFEHLDAIRASQPTEPWDKQDRLNAIEAIETFLQFHENIRLADGAARPPVKSGHLYLGGIVISVAPDLVVRRKRDGVVAIGGVKLCITKNSRLSEQASGVVTTLMQLRLEQRFEGTQFAVDSRLCQAVDVFGCRVFTPSTAFSIPTIREIEDHCISVGRLWTRFQAESSEEQSLEIWPQP